MVRFSIASELCFDLFEIICGITAEHPQCPVVHFYRHYIILIFIPREAANIDKLICSILAVNREYCKYLSLLRLIRYLTQPLNI